MIEASGLEEVPEAFFLYPRVKCDLYRFFPVGVGTFPTELSGRGRFLFRGNNSEMKKILILLLLLYFSCFYTFSATFDENRIATGKK